MADTSQIGSSQPRRRWLALAGRIGRLAIRGPGGDDTAALVRAGYDRIAGGYDDAWTHHMRDLSLEMLDRLDPPGGEALDLTCGSGFVTNQLATRTGRRAIGVDASGGMIEVARRNHGAACDFVQAEAIDYLRRCQPGRFDVVTCAWGLGYCRPVEMVRRIARVLKPGGRVGIIDNTLFSLAGVLWAAIRAFAESPESLAHVMSFRFLPNSAAAAVLFRLAGLGVRVRWDGSRTYHASDGSAAIARLTATGAAAGFEFAATAADRDRIFARFARLIEQDRGPGGVPITHRYLAVIGARR